MWDGKINVEDIVMELENRQKSIRSCGQNRKIIK